MKRTALYSLVFIAAALGVLIFLGILFGIQQERVQQEAPVSPGDGRVFLPPHREEGPYTVEQALGSRRSVRGFAPRPLRLTDVSQLLWACQGISGPGGLRTAPSAGALYPLEVYLVAGEVEGLAPGIYRYIPAEHALETVRNGDFRIELSESALNQAAVRDAPAVLVIAAVYERTTGKYGERGIRYVDMEAGHAAQNVYLQAGSLDIGTVSIGAFHDGEMQKILSLEDETPLYLMPMGYLI